ncbi:MAG: hypothetical protein HQK51_20615 [Oligoflexia bacterium]|nr:hypothetical protein [Oligoflexia bacterium]
MCFKIIFKFSLVIMLLLQLTSIAQASWQEGLVQELRVLSKEWVVFYLDGNLRTDIPACAKNTYWVLNPATEAGKKMFSVLMGAKFAKAKVRVEGANDCVVSPRDGETVDVLRLL